MTIEEWEHQIAELAIVNPGNAGDDLIDSVIESCISNLTEVTAEESRVAAHFFTTALPIAVSDLTRRDAAFHLVIYAGNNDVEAIDALIAQYRQTARESSFLSTEFLHALSILAERSYLAHNELVGLLLRLNQSSQRYLLITAAKVLTRLEGASATPTPTLRAKLDEWAISNDPAVQAEVLFQKATLALGDVLRVDNLVTLDERLVDCRIAFHQAELAEEIRDDARIYVALIDLLRAFPVTEATAPVDINEIKRRCSVLESIVLGIDRSWHGMQSEMEDVAQFRILNVARAMTSMSESVTKAEEWTNFDEALTEIAALFLLLRGSDESLTPFNTPLQGVATHLALPYFGPVIDRAVGRTRFAKVIERYVALNGEDDVSVGLRLIYGAASAREFAGSNAVTSEWMEAAFHEALKSEETLAFFLDKIPEARARFAERIPENFRSAEPLFKFLPPLPIDFPESFGNSPDVDATARQVFRDAKARLGSGFSRKVWNRFQQVTIFLIQQTLVLRDEAPPFTMCIEDKGKGHDAKESDLQEYIGHHLKSYFGARHSFIEMTNIAGGRVDLALRFEECDIPLEVKAEHKDISREHIKQAFLRQGEIYATARDRLACLLILDLRPQNSDMHRDRVRVGRKNSASQAKPTLTPISGDEHKPYRLMESFWVTGMPGDPQITNPELNAVLVCLFQGNRAKPSSSSTYSYH